MRRSKLLIEKASLDIADYVMMQQGHIDATALTSYISAAVSKLMREASVERVDEIREKMSRLMYEQSLPYTPAPRKKDINLELAELASEKKELHRRMTAESNVNKYILLKSFVRERYGDGALAEFFKSIEP